MGMGMKKYALAIWVQIHQARNRAYSYLSDYAKKILLPDQAWALTMWEVPIQCVHVFLASATMEQQNFQWI